MKVLLIDFSGSGELKQYFPKNVTLLEENKDGAAAYKIAGSEMPDMIFINYSAKPSHGRETAKAIKEQKKTEEIPIYFVEGDEPDSEKIINLGSHIRNGQIASIIESGRARGG